MCTLFDGETGIELGEYGGSEVAAKLSPNEWAVDLSNVMNSCPIRAPMYEHAGPVFSRM